MTVPDSEPEALPAPAPRRADLGPFDNETTPVDRQADPASWLSGRTLVIAVGISVVALIVTIVVCLLIWSTPTPDVLPIPTEPKI